MAQWRWREVRKALDILRADEQLYAVELHGVKVTKVLRCKLGSKAGASNNDVKEAQPDPARPALTSRQRRSAQRKRDFLQAKREPTAAAAVAAAAAAAAPAAPAAPAAVATTERGTLAEINILVCSRRARSKFSAKFSARDGEHRVPAISTCSGRALISPPAESCNVASRKGRKKDLRRRARRRPTSRPTDRVAPSNVAASRRWSSP